MPFIRLKCTRGNLRFLPQYRARSRLRRKQALRAQSSFGEAGQSAHWIGKLKKSPPRITPKRDWAAMETNHAASPGSAPCSCARCGMLSLCFPPHTLECANVVFACPTNGTTAKRPAFVRRGQGAMLRALRPRPPRGCFPLRFPLQAPECVNAAFACPTNGTTAKRPASGRRRVGRYAVSFAAAPAAGVLPLWLPPHAPECVNAAFACPTNGTTAKRPASGRRGAGRSV